MVGKPLPSVERISLHCMLVTPLQRSFAPSLVGICVDVVWRVKSGYTSGSTAKKGQIYVLSHYARPDSAGALAICRNLARLQAL